MVLWSLLHGKFSLLTTETCQQINKIIFFRD
jgi:hypothetical protein